MRLPEAADTLRRAGDGPVARPSRFANHVAENVEERPMEARAKLLYERDPEDAFVTLTMNRPEKMNAIDAELGDAIEAAVKRA